MTDDTENSPDHLEEARLASPVAPMLPKKRFVHVSKQTPGQLKPLTGANSDTLSQELCNQLISSGWYPPGRDPEEKSAAMLDALDGLRPATEIEGMMAAQIIACHCNAMECHRRAMQPDTPHHLVQHYLNLATKLSRSYAALLEALNKHRDKRQQTVNVEQVHVHDGGQAIVGQVQIDRGPVRK